VGEEVVRIPVERIGRETEQAAAGTTAEEAAAGQAPIGSRTVHARLEAPTAVRVEEPFPLVVGIAATPSAGALVSAGFQVPTGALTLTVTLMLDGFRTADGSSPVRTLVGSDDVPYPAAVLDLVAVDDPAYKDTRGILAVYSVDGHQLGVATRYVRVHAGAEPPAGESRPERAPKVWALPTGGTPDLQITVARANDTAGRQLQWTAHSPHPEVRVPATPVTKRLDDDAAGEWARRVMRGVESRKGAADLAAYLRGIQLLVGRQVPREIWAALRSAAEVADGHPTVLFATAEPFLPWELARVPEPWDPDRPDLLGAQTDFGRWLYEDDSDVPAPVPAVDVTAIAVVKGQYAGGARLPEAEAEADHLVEEYGATEVRADTAAVLACLRGTPAADVVHFAVHGRLDVAGVQDGIIMNDKTALDPISILGVESGRPRLAFVNACQVGESQQMLGDTAGIVPSLIHIGAQGVIAPLWKVDDTAAREFAERFYSAVFAGRTVSDVLAEERAQALAAGDSPQSTVLAYLFFGHPRLTVTTRREDHHAAART
jgi:hypothetical protein